MPITGESVLVDRLEGRDCRAGAGWEHGNCGQEGKRPWIALRDAR